MSKFSFPKINKVIIRNFSLYTKNDIQVEITESVPKGVYCLAGANGLGKTTFLNILNYGLTGLVLSPDSGILTPLDLYKANKRFTENYFNGRILAKHKELAEVELQMQIGENQYKIVRGFFNSTTSLRALEIFKIKEDRSIIIFQSTDESPGDLDSKYKSMAEKDIGIDSFVYYAFLQLYVLTFDESRRLIFWDDEASSHTLSIAFNNNMTDADELIKTRRKMEKYESDARNNRWQATQIRNKIENFLKANPQNSDFKRAQQDYHSICNNYDLIRKDRDDKAAIYESFLKRQGRLNFEISDLRKNYNKLFESYSEPRYKLLTNDSIKKSLDNCICLICGAKGSHIPEKIQINLNSDTCPLCNTRIDHKDNIQERDCIIDTLREIDAQLSKKRIELDSVLSESDEALRLLDKVTYEFDEISLQKNNLENDYPEIRKISQNKDEEEILKDLSEQFRQYDMASKQNYKDRDELQPKLEAISQRIEKTYKEAELIFVPVFQQLAKLFIGFDINIEFYSKSREMKLNLKVNKKLRTESSHLSESQRFFIDIALRMALIIYLAKEDNMATMFIDTPEGSLDIAYENRVGRMFADFVKKYKQNILMTANINASQLLIALASTCKSEYMVLKRMLDWTDLSSIQKEGEGLFARAFSDIENTLNS